MTATIIPFPATRPRPAPVGFPTLPPKYKRRKYQTAAAPCPFWNHEDQKWQYGPYPEGWKAVEVTPC